MSLIIDKIIIYHDDDDHLGGARSPDPECAVQPQRHRHRQRHEGLHFSHVNINIIYVMFVGDR